MATNGTESKMRDNEMGADGVSRNDFENATKHMSHEEKHAAAKAAKFGYGPLAHMGTNAEGMLPGKQTLHHHVVTSTNNRQLSEVTSNLVSTSRKRAVNLPIQLLSVSRLSLLPPSSCP